jgi:hypothetical protein
MGSTGICVERVPKMWSLAWHGMPNPTPLFVPHKTLSESAGTDGACDRTVTSVN